MSPVQQWPHRWRQSPELEKALLEMPPPSTAHDETHNFGNAEMEVAAERIIEMAKEKATWTIDINAHLFRSKDSPYATEDSMAFIGFVNLVAFDFIVHDGPSACDFRVTP